MNIHQTLRDNFKTEQPFHLFDLLLAPLVQINLLSPNFYPAQHHLWDEGAQEY